jgi:osmotically-inducible protein OsmY
LVLNNGSVPIETCVRSRLLPRDRNPEPRTAGVADKLVESRVRAALGDAFATPVDIRVEKGKVTLTGTTMGPIGNVEEVVRSVPGVTDVENRVMVVRTGAA